MKFFLSVYSSPQYWQFIYNILPKLSFSTVTFK